MILSRLTYLFWKLYEVIIRAFFTPLAYVAPWLFGSIRFLGIETRWIGHLAEECDVLVKEVQLGLRPKLKYLLVVLPTKKCNRCLLQYWKEHLTVIDTPWRSHLLYPFSRIRALTVEVNEGIMAQQTATIRTRVQNKWIGHLPLLKITPQHEGQSREILHQLGMPRDAWFVTFHARDSGYKGSGDDPHRNADIQTYLLAMNEVIERGGWCIRVGDSTMPPLREKVGIIDYAHSKIKSDAMDIFLCGYCRYFIGTCSGPYIVAAVFGRPIGLTNAVPITTTLPYGYPAIGIPKLYFSKKLNRILTLKESFDSNIHTWADFEKNEIELQPNTPEDIRDVFLDLIEEKYNYNPDNIDLQKRASALMRPQDYSYGAPNYMGYRFLKKHDTTLFT